MVTENEALAIKTRVAPQLLALPGVTAVGLGSKETAGRPTGELALKVFVTVKRPADQLAAAELIPREIDGLPTDVIQSGRRHLLADPPGAVVLSDDGDETRSRPLVGGRRIRREDSGYAGTMGCFLVDPAHVGTAYGLTNLHVVAVPDVPPLAAGTSAVGQPTGKSSVTGCCNDLFGKYAGGELADGQDEPRSSSTRERSGRPRSPTSASSPDRTRSPWPRRHRRPTTYASAAPGRCSRAASSARSTPRTGTPTTTS